jgi:ABC-type transport system substrate-binding protein
MRGIASVAALLVGVALVVASAVAGSPMRTAIVRADFSPADSLDPFDAQWSLERQIGRATCLNLLTHVPRRATGTPQLAPEAAGYPTVSEDGRTYAFTIRRGPRFSDGERVTPRSFTRAILRAARSDGPGRRAVGLILGMGSFDRDYPVLPEGVRVHGRRLILRLRRPAADFAGWIASPYLCAMSGQRIGIQTRPAAGPYYVVTAQQATALRKNRYYRGPRAPKLDAIVFEARSRRSDERVERVRQGVADWVAGRELSPRAHAELARSYGVNRGRYWASPVAALTYLRLNRSNFPAFSEPRIRRALAYAVDRVALARALGPSAGDPTDQSLPQQLTGYRDAAIYRLRSDPDRARAAAGRTLDLFTTCVGDCPVERALQRSLGRAGIMLRLLHCAIPEGCRDHVEIRTLSASQRDGADFLRELVRDQTDFDYAEHFTLIARADVMRGHRRETALAALDARFAREPWYAIPLYVERDRHFFSARVGCVRFDPVYGLDVAALCLRRR